MPIFYFNVNGDTFHWTDVVGKRCNDMLAVRREAHRIAGEMVSTSLIAGRVPDEAMIEVEDEDLRPVLALPIRYAAS